jgi:hypothetical protein
VTILGAFCLRQPLDNPPPVNGVSLARPDYVPYYVEWHCLLTIILVDLCASLFIFKKKNLFVALYLYLELVHKLEQTVNIYQVHLK